MKILLSLFFALTQIVTGKTCDNENVMTCSYAHVSLLVLLLMMMCSGSEMQFITTPCQLLVGSNLFLHLKSILVISEG